ncbi:translation initiation factor SUI1, partial [Pseudoalteromonas rubra]
MSESRLVYSTESGRIKYTESQPEPEVKLFKDG